MNTVTKSIIHPSLRRGVSASRPILSVDERLEILRRTAGSIAPTRAKKMLMHIATLRKELDSLLARHS